MTQANNVTSFPTPHLAVPSLDELVSERMWLATAHDVVDQLLRIRQEGREWTEVEARAWERVKDREGR